MLRLTVPQTRAHMLTRCLDCLERSPRIVEARAGAHRQQAVHVSSRTVTRPDRLTVMIPDLLGSDRHKTEMLENPDALASCRHIDISSNVFSSRSLCPVGISKMPA